MRHARFLLVCACTWGCSSASPTTTAIAPTVAVIPADAQTADEAQRVEQARRSALAVEHHKLEDEQASALAVACDREAAKTAEKRCTPSCYVAEPPDPRAKKKLAGPSEITHLVCAAADAGPFTIIDELGEAALAARPVRGRFPKPNKGGTWQADVEAAVKTALAPELGRADVVRVNGTWKAVTHPLTKERLRCATVSVFLRSPRRALDACGGQGAIACEAVGNAAAHGINTVHYRLAEAKQLQRAGKQGECQQAALEAIAVAHGMPRWRQYATLNTAQWKSSPRYRTRFDGTLDEDTLFTTATELGTEAQGVYAACGGGTPKTTAADEQSFHACW